MCGGHELSTGLLDRARRVAGGAGRWAGRRLPRREGKGGGARDATDRLARTWPLSRIIGVAVAITALLSVAAVAVGGLAIAGLSDARERLVTRLDPATFQALRLDTALVDQETGVRGYALSA